MFGHIRTNSKSWRCNKLGDLGDFKTGGTPSSKHEEFYNGTIPFISTPSLGPNYIDETAAKYLITQEAIDSCATTLIPAGSLIIGTRINVGQSSINKIPLCTNQDIVSMMNVSENYDLLFLKHCIEQYVPYLDSQKKGATIKGITVDLLKSISIPEPPIDLQRQYVNFVQQVDKSKAIVQKCIDKYDQLVKSRFIEMFGTLANPKYGLVKVADLVSKDIEKVAKKYDSEDIIDYIDISSINKESRSIMDTVEYAIKDAPSRAQQCVIKGDILLSNVRPNLKTLAIVNSKKNNLVCSSGFTVLRCTDSCPEYLMIAITDDYFTDKLVKKANGSNYPAVTSKDVYNSVVPSASIELQKQFAEFVQQVDKSKFNTYVMCLCDKICNYFIQLVKLIHICCT